MDSLIAYTQFQATAQDLLTIIESCLLKIFDDSDVQRLYQLIRAICTLKDAAAQIDQTAIHQVAHSLEVIVTALYNPKISLDENIKYILLQIYDGLRVLVVAELFGSTVDEPELLQQIAEGLMQIKQQWGDDFRAELPLMPLRRLLSSVPEDQPDRFDMLTSVFELEIEQRLTVLKQAIAHATYPDEAEPLSIAYSALHTCLLTQSEVFLGLAESLHLPGFGAIASTTLHALEQSPDHIVEIAQTAWVNFAEGQSAVLAGDRTQGGRPSSLLLRHTQTPCAPPSELASDVSIQLTQSTRCAQAQSQLGIHPPAMTASAPDSLAANVSGIEAPTEDSPTVAISASAIEQRSLMPYLAQHLLQPTGDVGPQAEPPLRQQSQNQALIEMLQARLRRQTQTIEQLRRWSEQVWAIATSQSQAQLPYTLENPIALEWSAKPPALNQSEQHLAQLDPSKLKTLPSELPSLLPAHQAPPQTALPHQVHHLFQSALAETQQLSLLVEQFDSHQGRSHLPLPEQQPQSLTHSWSPSGLPISAHQLLCRVGEMTYAFPITCIEQVIFLPDHRLHQVHETRQTHLLLHGSQKGKEERVPVYGLAQLLEHAKSPRTRENIALQAALPDLQPTVPHDMMQSPIVVIQVETRWIGLVVDDIVTGQTSGVQPIGGAIAPPPFIQGCCIFGDNQLALVIDPPTLIRHTLAKPDTLRAFPQSPPAPSRAHVVAPHSPQSPPGDRSTVLLVDDSPTVRYALAIVLEDAGYRVLHAGNGHEALEQLRKHPDISMTICDIEMPQMDGLQFLDEYAKEEEISHTPVVMLSSRSSRKHQQVAKQLGASAYLTKPFIGQSLLAEIQQYLPKQTP